MAIAMHAVGTPYKTLFIIAGAIAAFVLALRAKKIGISWLYYTDTLLAQLACHVGSPVDPNRLELGYR